MEEALTPDRREPWLRELELGLHPALAQLLFSLQQVREDVFKHTRGLSGAPPASLSFHLRHLAGSIDRLSTYLAGQQLNPTQLAELTEEHSGGRTLQELLERVEGSLQKAEEVIRSLDPEQFAAPRYIGRQRIRTSAIGLAIHIAEHAQRHTGQIICACSALRR